jgi:hypothetical protein
VRPIQRVVAGQQQLVSHPAAIRRVLPPQSAHRLLDPPAADVGHLIFDQLRDSQTFLLDPERDTPFKLLFVIELLLGANLVVARQQAEGGFAFHVGRLRFDGFPGTLRVLGVIVVERGGGLVHRQLEPLHGLSSLILVDGDDRDVDVDSRVEARREGAAGCGGERELGAVRDHFLSPYKRGGDLQSVCRETVEAAARARRARVLKE